MEEFKIPSVATTVLLENEDSILLIKRSKEPFKDKWVLPGGFVEYGERVEDAAVREAKEETGLDVKLKDILAINSDPDRDPRRHVIDVVFVAEITNGHPTVTEESTEIKWVKLEETGKYNMGFDHGKVIEDYKKWKQSKGTYWSTK